MAPTIHKLLWQLRHVERTVPSWMRDQENYVGLTVDAKGSLLTFYQGGNVEVSPWDLPAFCRAANEAGLKRDDDVKPMDFPIAAMGSALPNHPHLGACDAGDPGFSVDCSNQNRWPCQELGNGTLGWFVVLDGQPVCIGNHHVFCPLGDETISACTSVFVRADLIDSSKNYEIGKLFAIDRMDDGDKRIFDLALVRIEDVRLLSGQFSPRELIVDGVRYPEVQKPYPLSLGSADVISEDDWFYMIGAGTPEVVMRHFAGIGSRKIEMRGVRRMFFEQLLFTPRSELGDSGAVVVHDRTNSVIGLNSAFDPLFAITNPLYRKRWKYRGLKTIDGVTLPELRSRCGWLSRLNAIMHG